MSFCRLDSAWRGCRDCRPRSPWSVHGVVLFLESRTLHWRTRFLDRLVVVLQDGRGYSGSPGIPGHPGSPGVKGDQVSESLPRIGATHGAQLEEGVNSLLRLQSARFKQVGECALCDVTKFATDKPRVLPRSLTCFSLAGSKSQKFLLSVFFCGTVANKGLNP